MPTPSTYDTDDTGEVAEPNPYADLPPLRSDEAFDARMRNPVLPADVREYAPGYEANFNGVEIWYTTLRRTWENRGPGHKYYGRSGQTVEWTGSEPDAVSLETEWFGENWRRRRDELVYQLKSNPHGTLTILGEETMVAFFRRVEMSKDGNAEGCSMSLVFEQDDHAAVTIENYPVAPIVRLEESLAADDLEAVTDEMDAFADAVADRESVSDPELKTALVALDTVLSARMATIDSTTLAGVERLDGLILARYYARQAVPDELWP